MKTDAELYDEAVRLMPGGVNSPVRACRAVGTTPKFISRAEGAYVFDAEGRRYLDYVGSWGPAILGHAHPAVVEAVRRAAVDGLSFGAPTERETLLAGMIRELMPSIEMMRMVSSGTEAVMSALRVARGFTGRADILKFEGCYHGHSDGMLVKAGSGLLTCATPDSAGVPADFARHTLVAPYNDCEAVADAFRRAGNTIAAVIVEPIAANMGVVPPRDGFLEFLREITRKYGALLIFDEVITGFRLGLGGAQAHFGITPDLTTLGKIVGGGMPAAVYGGRADIMRTVAPEGKVYQAGTLSGNPLATAAGIATLQTLRADPSIYERLERLTRRLADGLRRAANNKIEIPQVGSLLSMRFPDDSVFSRWYAHILENNIYAAPSRFEAMFVSAAHTESEIDTTIAAAERFFQ